MLTIQSISPSLDKLLREEPITVVDAGCAGGIDPTFVDLSKQGYADNIGFEANPEEFEKLSAIRADPRCRTVIHNMALLDRDGTITFNACGTVGSVYSRPDREVLYGETYGALQVECAALDTLRSNGTIGRPIDVLKVDVEGSELAVLNGAANALASEVLCIKVEFGFHSPTGTNNFGELHVKLVAAGFRLLGLSVNHFTMIGLEAGDALYVRRPEVVLKMPGLSANAKRLKLLHLAAICLGLRQGEYLALIARVGDGLLTDLDKRELKGLAMGECFVPNVVPFSFPRLSQAVFALSQLLAGRRHGTKSAPKVNRLVPLRVLFVKPRWTWIRRHHEQELARKVRAYLVRASVET
jgi:FkbM family methyltransferase